MPLGQATSREVGSPSSDLRPRGRSLLLDHFRGSILNPSSPDIMNGIHAARNLNVNVAFDEWGLLARRSPSERPDNSLRSPRDVIDMTPSPLSRVELCENGLEVTNSSQCNVLARNLNYYLAMHSASLSFTIHPLLTPSKTATKFIPNLAGWENQ